MKLQLIFYCALVFYLDLAASIPSDVYAQRYSRVNNTKPEFKTYYPPNVPLAHQGFNQNTNNAGTFNNLPRQNPELPRINTFKQFPNYQLEYGTNVPRQVFQEPNKGYLNQLRLPFNNANSPIYRRWRNVNLPAFQNKPIQNTPGTNLSVTEKKYLDFKNNQGFEAYNSPQTRHVAPVPLFGNPSNANENSHLESVTKENSKLLTKHQELVQDNGHVNKVSANINIQSFTPQIPSVPPKIRDPRAKSKSMLINRIAQPIENKAENKAPFPVPANFADRLLGRASNPVEQKTKTVKMPSHNLHNLISDANIDQVLYSSKHKKRYLVIHPNGTIEHVDTLESVSKRHPNYVLVHAGDILPKPASKVEKVPEYPVLPQPVKLPRKANVNHTNAQSVSVVTQSNVKDQEVEITVAPIHKEIHNEKSNGTNPKYVQKPPTGNPPTVQVNNNENVTPNVIIQNEVIARPTIKVINDTKSTSLSFVKKAPTFEIVEKETPLSDARTTLITVSSTIQVANETKPFKNVEIVPIVSIPAFIDANTSPKQANTTNKSKIQVKKNVTNHIVQNTPLVKNIVYTKAIADAAPEKKEIINNAKVISSSKTESAPAPIVLTPGKEKELTVIKANTEGVQSNMKTNITNASNVSTEKKQSINNAKVISSSKTESAPAPIVLTPGKEKELTVIKANTEGVQSNMKTNITNASNVSTEKKQSINNAKAISSKKEEVVIVPAHIVLPSRTGKKPSITKANIVSVQPSIKTSTVNSSNVPPENKQTTDVNAISSSKIESVSVPIVLPPSKEKELASKKTNIASAQPNSKITIVNDENTPENYQVVNNTKAISSSKVETFPTPIMLPSGTEKEPVTTKTNAINAQPKTKFTIIYGANIPHDEQLTAAAASSIVQDVTSKSSTNNVISEASAQTLLASPPKVLNSTANVNSTLPKTAQIPTANNVVTAIASIAEKPKVTSIIPENQHRNPGTSNSTKPISTSGSISAKQQDKPYPKMPGDLDISKVKSQEKPAVWFKTTDSDFWDKLTDGNETYDVVYFFQIHNQPKVENDTKKTIYPNGTIVEEITKSVWEDGQDTPKITRTAIVTHPEKVM